MAENERKIRWPDGVSLSLPRPLLPGRIGGTYYWSPGADSAPHFTVTNSSGLPGAGVNAVFLRKGMTSSDTLGPGVSANVSTILPSVTLNGTVPFGGNYTPRVTTVEAGIGTPNASPAFTTTFTPHQVAEFLRTYDRPPPSPEWRRAFVRDSAAAAGVPSRNNVFEYGYPDPDGGLSQAREMVSADSTGAGTIGGPGQRPVRYLSRREQYSIGDGMGDWRASTMPVDSSNPPAVTPPRPGGLYGLMLDYLRGNYPSDR
ncbi:hypothetical protein ACE103_28650 [Bradyrhizobium sp. ma5]|uniref:hypothetical protein n=1 Tax=Bradyrhizobium sp. ma5 TaxID=3344828 RepID=UPI0035D4A3C4